jgi:hypothetical protein
MSCRRLRILTVGVAAAAVLVAGCGGGSSPGVANVTSPNPSTSSSSGGNPTGAQLQQAQHDVERFADCVRSHGVSSFPDPTISPRAFKNAFANESPAFRSAYAACGHLLPAGRPATQNPARSQAQTAALLAFARCLRSHGFPTFPDPNSNGQLTREMLANARIDIHQRAVVLAADACTGVTHGVITKAVVARFVAGR